MTSTTTAQSGTSPRPLEGLRVVDLTVINGELCPRLLCDLGAEVIRIGEIERNTELAGVVHRKRQRDTLTNGSP